VYIFPLGAHEDINTPAMVAKYKAGPVGRMTVFPSGPAVMPKFLAMWFGYGLIIGYFVAYLAGRTVAFGTPFRAAFPVAWTTAFLAYGIGQLSNGIWRGHPGA
jgi:hypothetical protein